MGEFNIMRNLEGMMSRFKTPFPKNFSAKWMRKYDRGTGPNATKKNWVKRGKR